jgi:GH15 family glucan-1,4-alpha-glucosidase
MSARYKNIEDYGIIGDLHTIALVAMDGSIDFMCFPDFDSPSVFAALLDADKGGRFKLAPVLEDCRHKQLYLPDSNILLTRFLSDEGIAEVSDFMPIEEDAYDYNLVRRAKCVRGEITFRLECSPRFNYARASHKVERGDGAVVFISEGPDKTALRLRSPVDLEIKNGDAHAEFTLRAGQTAAFVLEEAVPAAESPSRHPDFVGEAFKATNDFWHHWASRCRYSGRWRETVMRSALVLKLLTSQKHGSIVAAPTFALPEEIGGVRNWDYRYTWIRDASFTVYALVRLGYTEELTAFMRWIEARCAELNPDGSLQIMYGIDGRHELPEESLDHLEGYRGSSPVRIGNGAWDQMQLDIYGELMDAVYLYNKYAEPVHHDLWQNLIRMLDWVCENWRRKDEGIWEVRGGAQEFLYSRVMCWVALDRGIRLSNKRSLPAPLDRWMKSRDEIYREIFTNFWSAERQAFVQHKGSDAMDAAALAMPLFKLLGPADPRWLTTLAAIEEDLVDDSLVYRYRTQEAASDGLSGEEGTFSICSFWYVECLSRAGQLKKARLCLEKALGYANHVGLYAEELGRCAEHLGNYPQAFTHLALISAAFDLDRRLDPRD